MSFRYRPLVAAALLAALFAAPASAETLRGKVIKVADGDTVTIMTDAGKERIRLLGIDTPEKKQLPWGPRAKAFTEQQVMGKEVRVETDVEPRDRYGRVLGYVYVGRTFLNLELVRQGYAMLYTSPPNVAHTDELVAAQREARQAGRNIWSPRDGLTETPYEYRHKGKKPPKKIGQEGLPAAQ
ncbi:MAG TPA: thermonuclease family protein [Pantanalinema sp.]